MKWKQARSRPAPINRPVHRKASPLLVGIVLGLLAILATGMTGLALVKNQNSAMESSPVLGTEDRATPRSSGTSTGQSVSETSTGQSLKVAVPTRLLSVDSTTSTLLRAQTGKCSETPGQLETSSNDGETWSRARIEKLPQAQIRQFDTTGNAAIRVALFDRNCEPKFAESTLEGSTWKRTTDKGRLWYLDSEDSKIVNTPDGRSKLPCTGVALSSSAHGAIVLCSDSHITVSANDRAAWSDPHLVEHVTAVGTTNDGFVVAIAEDESCSGVRIQLLVDEKLGKPSKCLDAEVDEGTVAVAGDAQAIYIWAGDTFARSNDGGLSWQ